MFPAGLVEREERWAGKKVRLEELGDAAAWMWVTVDWWVEGHCLLAQLVAADDSGSASWRQLPLPLST